MNIAFVDLDGVICDNTDREARAKAFVDSRFVPEEGIVPSRDYREAWLKIFHSERALYKPEWVFWDTLMVHVNQDVMELHAAGYKVIILTSRPESMRRATVQWLFEHTVYGADDILVMKPPPFTFTKTKVWKAGMIQTLAMLYDGVEVMVIDNEQDNIDELVSHDSLNGRLHVYRSLTEAVASLG